MLRIFVFVIWGILFYVTSESFLLYCIFGNFRMWMMQCMRHPDIGNVGTKPRNVVLKSLLFGYWLILQVRINHSVRKKKVSPQLKRQFGVNFGLCSIVGFQLLVFRPESLATKLPNLATWSFSLNPHLHNKPLWAVYCLDVHSTRLTGWRFQCSVRQYRVRSLVVCHSSPPSVTGKRRYHASSRQCRKERQPSQVLPKQTNVPVEDIRVTARLWGVKLEPGQQNKS